MRKSSADCRSEKTKFMSRRVVRFSTSTWTPDAGAGVADERLADAVNADGIAGERVLHEADDRAGEGAEDGIAACDREEDDGKQGEVEDEKPRQDLGQQACSDERRAAPDDGERVEADTRSSSRREV